MINKRAVGKEYEIKAANFLKQLGYKILEKNYTTKQGEIDIIAFIHDTYIFVEVKFRQNDKKGYPFEMVTKSKQRKIMKTAISYCLKKKLFGNPMRFDIISILENDITHYKNAFEMDQKLCRF